MKHIAYLCTDAGIPVFGTKGASIHVQSVVRAALKAGHRVTLFATRFDGPIPPGLEGAACVQLPELPQGDREKRAHAALQSHPRSMSMAPSTSSTSAIRSGATWACAGRASSTFPACWRSMPR